MKAPGPVEQAVHNFIDSGLYPEDDDVVTAELPSPTLQSLSNLLDRARSDVKTSIRELSRLSAPDIDGWINQAKQLKDDVSNSVADSADMVDLGHSNLNLQEHTADALGKVNLLQNEVVFNQGLVDSLEKIRHLRGLICKISQATEKGEVLNAVSNLGQARAGIDSLDSLQAPSVKYLLAEGIDEAQRELHSTIHDHWDHQLILDPKRSCVTVESIPGRSSFEDVATALGDLDLLGPKVAVFWSAFDTHILSRCLQRRPAKAPSVHVNANTLTLSEQSSKLSTEALLDQLHTICVFLQRSLPSTVSRGLFGVMIPSLTSRLIAGPLQAAVPADLGGIPSFVAILESVTGFEQRLHQLDGNDTSALSAWVVNAPNVWLEGRSAESLNGVRQLLKRGLGNPRTVERVETQIIIEDSGSGGVDRPENDWDAEWDETDAPATHTPTATQLPGQAVGAEVADDGDTDGNAWGWDEETEQQESTSEAAAAVADDEEGGEAWGWGEDERLETPVIESHPATQRVVAQQESERQHENGTRSVAAPVERTITLRESYYVTALPESLLELTIMVIDDADNLSRSQDNPVATAAQGLFELPASLLAMFRANAPSAYASNESGNMFLYNDSIYLAEQLGLFANHRASRHDFTSLDLQSDIAALESFGKRAYGKEMDSQRIVLGDMLDGAEGFVSCTDDVHASQCDLAIASVSDRLRQVHSQWKRVLSPSALLQSTGSLLNGIVSKIILDIEDLGDIQESESKALTGYCTSIESLEDLFIQSDQGQGSEQIVPLTAGYVSSWLKFQYLANILDSSLADIKYLWSEGRLSLEFEAEEVVDLIQALFADSARRKDAIGEIRRSSRR